MWGVSVCGGLCECVCGSVCALGVCRCVCGRVQVCGVCMWVCMSMCGVSVCVGRCVRWVCAGGGVAGVWGVYVVVCEHVWGEVWGGGECVWGWCVRWVCVGEASQKVQTPSCRINVMGVLVTVVNNVQCAVRKCAAGCENKLGIVNLHNDSL